jgi:hypothetical protein
MCQFTAAPVYLYEDSKIKGKININLSNCMRMAVTKYIHPYSILRDAVSSIQNPEEPKKHVFFW